MNNASGSGGAGKGIKKPRTSAPPDHGESVKVENTASQKEKAMRRQDSKKKLSHNEVNTMSAGVQMRDQHDIDNILSGEQSIGGGAGG